MQCVYIPAQLVKFFDAQGIKVHPAGGFAIHQAEIDAHLLVNVEDAMISGAGFVVDSFAKLEGIYSGLHHSVVSSEDRIPPQILVRIANEKASEYAAETKSKVARIYHCHTSSPNGDLRLMIEDMIYEAAKSTIRRIDNHRASRAQKSPYKQNDPNNPDN